MSATFGFDRFDLDIAIALGEVPEDTQLENYLAYKPEPIDSVPAAAEASTTMKNIFGIKALGSTAFPPGFKPRS